MKLRRITALLLTAVMLFPCIGVKALAEEETGKQLSESIPLDPDDTAELDNGEPDTYESDDDELTPPESETTAVPPEISDVTDQVNADVTTYLGEVPQGSLSLILADDLEDGARPEIGSTVTYTVTIQENVGGFCVGTFYFSVSECLEYESATLLGKGVAASMGDVPGTEYKNAYGILYLTEDGQNYTEGSSVLCTITFRVVKPGELKTALIPHDVRSRENLAAPLTVSVTDNTTSHTVLAPEKPTITTATLPDGVLGKNYPGMLECDGVDASWSYSWEIASGSLPKGLELLND
ncbi:MAG: hypothetical protein IJD10_00035, partial [Clostridia bacterium]|nr:hypothetical protein [Clostridia bacterium]